MKTILGTGQLGITIMEILLEENPKEEILLVNRKGLLETALPENVQLMAADVTNHIDMEQIAKRSEVIFSCTDVPYQMWEDFYPAAASALADALRKSNSKLVFADNLYSYGNVGGAVMHEGMPRQSITKKGRIRTGVMNTLLNSADISNRVAFVKSADFIGPRIHKGLFGKDFLDRIDTGKAVILSGKTALPHTFTYIRDFAKAMINVGTASDTFGQIWHVPNAPAISPDKWVKLFEAQVGKNAKVIVLPKIVVRFAGLFNSLIKEFYELAYQFEHPYLLNHDKYIGRFGNHSTDHSAIVKATVQWYRSTKSK